MNRIAVLNVGLLALIGFIVFVGVFPISIFNTAIYPIVGLSVFIILGIILLLFNRIDDCKWISNHMTRFGMIGTIIGMITGLGGLEFTTIDVAQMATELAHHTAFAFYSTLVGVVGNIWLNLNLRMVD